MTEKLLFSYRILAKGVYIKRGETVGTIVCSVLFPFVSSEKE